MSIAIPRINLLIDLLLYNIYPFWNLWVTLRAYLSFKVKQNFKQSILGD